MDRFRAVLKVYPNKILTFPSVLLKRMSNGCEVVSFKCNYGSGDEKLHSPSF